MKKSILILNFILFVLVIPCVDAEKSYSQAQLRADLQAASVSGKDTGEIYKEYIMNSDDADLIYRIAYIWRKQNNEALEEEISRMIKKNPDNDRYLFANCFISDDIFTQIEAARKFHKEHPDSIWSALAVAEPYALFLMGSSVPSDIDTEKLKTEWEKDNSTIEKLEKGYEVTKRLDVAAVLYQYYRYTDIADKALEMLKIGESAGVSWFNPFDAAVVYAANGNFDEAKAYVDKAVDMQMKMQRRQQMPREELKSRMYSAALMNARAYEEAILFMKSIEGYDTDPGILYNMACAHALKNDLDGGFKYLTQAAEHGWDSVDHVKTDPDLKSLWKDPRWDKAMKAVQAAWNKGAETRRNAIIANKIDTPAPVWSLKNLDDETVSLSDMKGNIVILDFWATWCSPCMMAMPALDKWTEKNKTDDIHVFSINIWERDEKKARKMFTEKDFDMTYLKGDNELGKKYKISGIPYICVLDGNGHIRFEQKGYSPALEETLTIWVDHLKETKSE